MGFFEKLFGKQKPENKMPPKPVSDSETINEELQEEPYGIDKNFAHPRAIELIPEDFFWSNFDELAPFGSDEGDTALAEFREWRKRNPKAETFECLRWTIEGVSEKNLSDYNEKILDEKLIMAQIHDEEFLDRHYIYTVDTSVIATGFAQLIDEGTIDNKNKPLIQQAIDRQKVYATKVHDWEHKDQYLKNLAVLERVLKE